MVVTWKKVNGDIATNNNVIKICSSPDNPPKLPVPLFTFSDEVHEAYEVKAAESKAYAPVLVSVTEPFEKQGQPYFGNPIIVDYNIAVQFKAEKFIQLMQDSGCEIHVAPEQLFTTLTQHQSIDDAIKANPCKLYVPAAVKEAIDQASASTTPLKDALMPKHKGEWGEIKPQDWLVHNMIHKKGITMWYGDTQAGKTTLLVDMCMHLGAGANWGGRQLEKTKVLIVTCEGGADVQEKVWAFERAKFPVPNDYIHKIDYQVSFAKDNLHVDTIIENIKELKIDFGLIVIDTLSQVALGLNFNSPEMGIVLARAHKLMNAFNCNVVLVAHVGKDATKGMTGWKGWSTNTESNIYVQMHSEEHRSMEVEKVKGRKHGETLHFMFEEEAWKVDGALLEVPVVKWIDSPETVKLTKRYQVLQQIVENPHKTQVELLKILKDLGNKFGAPDLSKACSWLRLNGMIMQVEKGFKATFAGEAELDKQLEKYCKDGK